MHELVGPVTTAPDPTEGATFRAWDELLTRLEEDVVAGRGAALAEEDTDPWTAPAGLGPLPAGLADRVRRIVAAQKASLAELQEERRAVGKHIDAVRSVSASRQSAQPVYLDVTG